MKQNNTAAQEHSARPEFRCRQQFPHQPAPQSAMRTCGRIINVSVITVLTRLHRRAVCQFFGGSNIGLRSITIRIVGNDPLLGFIVDLTDEVGLLCIRAHNNGLAVQHIETQLTEAAPNVDLVRVMVAGGVLAGLKARHMVKSVGRAAIGLTFRP